jgi:hypothetical protein
MSNSEIIFAVHSSSQGGYEARAIDHSIFVQTQTIDQLKLNAAEAVRARFGDENPLPELRLVEVPPGNRWLGSAKGEFTVRDDFNDPLPKDIEDLFWK